MLQLIFGFILTIVGSAVPLYERWKAKGEVGYKKSNRIALILLFTALGGAVLSLFAGIGATNNNIKSENTAQVRQNRIDSQSTIIYKLELLNHSLLNKDLEYSKRLDSSSWKNYILSNEIVTKTNQLNDYVTGEGSFCYFTLGYRDPATNSYQLELFSSGKNPMDNLVARIVDVYSLQANPSMGVVLHIGKLYPKIHTVHLFQTTITPTKIDSIWINVFFQTNGREFVEELKEIKVKGKWTISEIITEGSKTLFKRIDRDFPGLKLM